MPFTSRNWPVGGLLCSAVLAKWRFTKADIAKTPTVTAAARAYGCAFAIVLPFEAREMRDRGLRRAAVKGCSQSGVHEIRDDPGNIAAHNERPTLPFVPRKEADCCQWRQQSHLPMPFLGVRAAEEDLGAFDTCPQALSWTCGVAPRSSSTRLNERKWRTSSAPGPNRNARLESI